MNDNVEDILANLVCDARGLEQHLDAALAAARVSERARCRATMAAVPAAMVEAVVVQALRSEGLTIQNDHLSTLGCRVVGAAVLRHAIEVLADATGRPS